MRTYILAALGAGLACVPAVSRAESPSYSFAEAGYVVASPDNFNKDFDGFVLRGSFEFVENWFGYARYLDQSADISGFNIDATQWAIGAGFAWPLSDALDIYGKAGYTEVDADADELDVSANDDGYELSVGLRGRVLDQLELEGAVNYVDLSDSGDTTAFGVAARWFFMDNFAVGLEGEFGDDADSYGMGVRWSFGGL